MSTERVARGRSKLLMGLLTGLLSLIASAAMAAGPAWTYKVADRVPAGQPAVLELGSHNGAHGVVVKLKGPGGRSKSFTFKTLKPGTLKALKFAVPNGVSNWTATVTGSADGAETTANLTLKIVSVGPLDVTLSKRDVDLGGKIVVVTNRAVQTAEVKGFGSDGLIVDDTVDLDGASGRVAIEFAVSDDDQLKRLEVKILDEFGFWAAVRVVSWFVELPHDDVVFESGKWAVQPTEAPKIDGVFTLLDKEIARFKRELGKEALQVDLKVYVGGYTDTVGAPGDNRVLSRKRARAIAEYFRGHGVKLPIFYQGFGESVLAAPTGDNVDNAQNRRALYVLSNVPPRGGKFPGAAWTRLK